MNRKLFGDERGRAIKIDSIRPQEVSGKASKGLNWKVRSALVRSALGFSIGICKCVEADNEQDTR